MTSKLLLGMDYPGGQMSSTSAGNSLRYVLILVGAYLALAILITWPIVLDLSDSIIGYHNCTNRMHVWVLWVVKQLLMSGYAPTETNYIFFPLGANLVLLYGSDLFYPVVLSPLVELLSPGIVFNLKLIFSFTMGAMGAALLMRQVAVGRLAAGVGGALFMIGPYFLLETFNGVSELVAVEWIPFALLYLLRSQGSQGRVKDTLLCALFSLMAAYSSGYNIFFLLLFGMVLVAYRLLSSWRDGAWRKAIRLKPLILLGMVAAVGILPLGLLHRQGQTGDRVHEEALNMFDPESTPRMDSSAALTRFFRPGRNQIPWIKDNGDGTFEKTNTTYSVYLGLGILALAIFGFVSARPRATLWGIVALFFAILCLGPHLYFTEERLLLGGNMVPLPGYLLYKLLPGFAVTVRHSYRYVAMVHLALAVLAAMGLHVLLGRFKAPKIRAGVAAGVLLLCLGEILLVGPCPWPIASTSSRVPAFYHELAKDTEPYPIIELPYSDWLEHLQPMLMAQTVHQKKLIAGAVHHRLNDEDLSFINQVPLALSFLKEQTITSIEDRDTILFSVKALQVAGFRYVLVRDNKFETPHRAQAVNRYLTSIFGAPQKKADGIKVYDVQKVETGLATPPGQD